MRWNTTKTASNERRPAETVGPAPPGRRFASRFLHFGRNEAGAAAVVAAVLFPVVIGGMGLGAETGYWYMTQRKLQHAADTSVHAAGVRKRAGDTQARIEAAALHVATETGFSPPLGTLLVNTPPASGAYAGDGSSVEVIVEETRPRLFSAVFATEPVTFRGRAVARVSGGSNACLLALSRTKSGAVTVSGSTSVDLSNCDVASNSNALDSFLMSGNGAAISTDCVHTVGEAVTTAGLTLKTCPAVEENSAALVDPYASVPEPAAWGTCRNRKVGTPNGITTLTPTENHPSGVKSMRFCGGLDLKGEVRLDPGLYIVDGGSLTANGGQSNATSAARIIGEGVTILLANGATAKLNGNVSIDLAAPTSGPLSGILFFGGRSDTVSHVVSGTSDSVLQGALYTPASEFNYRGNSATTDGCTQIVADKIVFTGNSTLMSSCKDAGTKDILAGQIVTIVE